MKKLCFENLRNGQKQDFSFDELPCIIPKLTSAFLLFLSNVISFKAVGTKEMTIPRSFLAVLTISKKGHQEVHKTIKYAFLALSSLHQN